jgi:hypothetical protein
MQKSTGIFLKWMDIKVTVRNGTKIRISIVTLKGPAAEPRAQPWGWTPSGESALKGRHRLCRPFRVVVD